MQTLTYGTCYDATVDRSRLQKQHEVIRDLMIGNGWMTLGEIENITGYPQASISAQLRHLRKGRFGGYRVDKQRRSPGTWEYRVLEPGRLF